MTSIASNLTKLDERITIIIRNGVQLHHRTLVVMLGKRGREQVPIMYSLVTQAMANSQTQSDNNTPVPGRSNHVLWCYKSELGFSTHTKKVKKELHRKQKRGVDDRATLFEQFILGTDIRWCYYKDTEKVLGQTFGMLILQDFQALTPNILARTVETVCGGGIILLLLHNIQQLRQLCTMAMDVHTRYRTPSHDQVVGRFNERFLLSLARNKRCIVLDDEWKVLSFGAKKIKLIKRRLDLMTPNQRQLFELKENLHEKNSPFCALVDLCVTLDQTQCLLKCIQALIQNKKRNSYKNQQHNNNGSGDGSGSVVMVTAARGRGKSAALGLSLVAALQSGRNSIWLSAPAPENVSTLMQFVRLGLLSYHLQENIDFIQSKNEDGIVVRIDIMRTTSSRQCIVYVPPRTLAEQSLDSLLLCDLLCMDEVAAIPLHWVKHILFSSGNCCPLTLMASTMNGYEGTGRSLSVKLMTQLRQECLMTTSGTSIEKANPLEKEEENPNNNKNDVKEKSQRTLYEVHLHEAIRYGNGDPNERWLYDLLCLNCGNDEDLLFKEEETKKKEKISLQEEEDNNEMEIDKEIITMTPLMGFTPEECELFHVNRDTLFSYHTYSERFLHRLMNLFVSSHYRNSPNDLQLLADAPAHHLFVLLPPARYRYLNQEGNQLQTNFSDGVNAPLPFLLCVIQVCLEGGIARHRVAESQQNKTAMAGDLIPWTVSQQFNEHLFASLYGARIVRIATHPLYQSKGFGSFAINQLKRYYNGELSELMPVGSVCDPSINTVERVDLHEDLKDEMIKPRASSTLPPLLTLLNRRTAEHLDYVGVSFGMTHSLLKFWKKLHFLPVYLSEVANDLTGEFSGIMICQLKQPSVSMNTTWLQAFHFDFCKRMSNLFMSAFSSVDSVFALELIHHKGMFEKNLGLSKKELVLCLTSLDRQRLKAYVHSQCDFRLILDLLGRPLGRWFVMGKFDPKVVKLRLLEQLVLIGMGCQMKTADQLAMELRERGGIDQKFTGADILSHLHSLVRKLVAWFDKIDAVS